MKNNMDREKQEKEVMEFLKQEIPYAVWQKLHRDLITDAVKAIMRRYDLVPRGE